MLHDNTILEKLFRKKNFSSYPQVPQVSLTQAQSKAGWSQRDQADLFGARLVTPPAPPMQSMASKTPVKSSVQYISVQDKPSLIMDMLNYLAAEGEKLHSRASHLLFTKGSHHHLGWTGKSRLLAGVMVKPRNALPWHEVFSTEMCSPRSSFKEGHECALLNCP